MKTISGIKLKIMVRAFRIRIKNGEVFEDIAADYTALTTDDLEAIRAALNLESFTKEGFSQPIKIKKHVPRLLTKEVIYYT